MTSKRKMTHPKVPTKGCARPVLVTYHARARGEETGNPQLLATHCSSLDDLFSLSVRHFPGFLERSPWIFTDSQQCRVTILLDPD